MIATANVTWKKDPFLEAILGKAVYRLTDPKHAKEALEAMEREKSWMIETKVAVDAVITVAALTDLGFRIIDTNVQLDAPVAALTPGSSSSAIFVREARGEDRPAVERIAADNLVTSRFHLDQQLGHELGRRVKSAWAGNYFEGRRGERLFVAERDGAVGGFLLVLERTSVGTIDLIALNPELRGLGAVGALMRAWLKKATTIERVHVGTQISNVRSLRAYSKVGFRVCSASYVLHHHGFSSMS